ncbi:MAG: hypothetical protein AAB451_00360 [Patescibacteria group bacterium]
MRKLFIVLIILAAIGGLVGFWNYQRNTYSKDVLKLEILGPDQVILGEISEYTVKYKNNGNFRLDNPELIFAPPDHSLSGDQVVGRQILGKEKLGEAIYPGEEKAFTFSVRLLGKEGEARTAKATLSYQPKGLKARYESSTTFTSNIKSVPLTLEFDLPSKAESAQDFTFRLNYFSNINSLLTDLRVQLEYPVDFEFLESSPKSLDKTEWDIPVLNKSQGGRVEISGKVSGDVGSAKIFKAKLGIWKNGEFVLLKEAEGGVEITKASVFLRQEINNNPKYPASPGDWLHYEVFFKNIGDDALTNLFIVNKLEGDAFDFNTIKSDSGIFKSGDNSIVFDWKRVAKLQYLAPTEEGKVDFWVRVKDDLGNVKNPVLRNKVFASQVEEEFVTKIGSKMEAIQKGYFQDEVFGNSGPLPPRGGETTTYTILWQAKNYYSDVRDVKMKATLPQGVELTGKIFPEEEAQKFTFDSESREIVWSLGNLERGKGVLNSPPNFSFQVAFTPTVSQRGQTPNIIGQVQITGEDTWTESTLEATAPVINTTLPDDKTITPALGIVQ